MKIRKMNFLKSLSNLSKITFVFGLIFLFSVAVFAFLGHAGFALGLINDVYFVFVLAAAVYIGELFGEKD